MATIEGHRRIAPPEGVPVWDVDPYDPGILVDPIPYYAELRRRGPLVYIPRYAILACGRYDVTREIFSDHQRFVSSRGVGLTDFSLETPWRAPSIILEVDPPEHDKTRRVMTRVMSPGVVASLRETFQAKAEALVDHVLGLGRVEAVVDVAEAYSVAAFPPAVGLRNIDQRVLVDYGAMVFNALGPDNTLRRTAMAKAPNIVPWITEQCQRSNLHAEGIGAEIYAAADGGEITPTEASLLVRSLLSAGIDTTVTGIGSALWALANNPAQFERLRADPKLARNAFEETLRLTSPVHSFCRTVHSATSVSGIALEEGTKFFACSAQPISTPTNLKTRISSISAGAQPAIWRLVSGFTPASVRMSPAPKVRHCWAPLHGRYAASSSQARQFGDPITQSTPSIGCHSHSTDRLP
jgi:4-methoxybenzoate monooxygenase (O-demethylating)